MYTFLDFELITDNWISRCRSLFSKMSTKTDLAFAELNNFWNYSLFVFRSLCKNEYTASSSSRKDSSYLLRSLRMQPLTQGKMFFFWLLLLIIDLVVSSSWLGTSLYWTSPANTPFYSFSLMISFASSASSSNLINTNGLTEMSISSNFIERFELTLSIIILFCSYLSVSFSCCLKNSSISVAYLALLSPYCSWLWSASKGPSKKLVNK